MKSKRTKADLALLNERSGRVAMVCGLPTALTYLVADFISDLMQRAHGDCEVIGLNNISQRSLERLRKPASSILLLAEIADASVVRLASASDFPIVVVEQDFASAFLEFQLMRGATDLDAARTLSRSLICAIPIADIPRAAVLRPKLEASAESLVGTLARAFAIPQHTVVEISQSRGLDRPLMDLVALHFPEVIEGKKSPISQVLAQLDDFYRLDMRNSRNSLNLPLALLSEGRSPHHAATSPIPLVGPARCLTFGPYVHLPIGKWQCRIDFSTSNHIPFDTIGFDIIADREQKLERRYDVSASGLYRAELEFEICDAYAPVELRTFLYRGAIGGEFTLVSVCFSFLQ